MPTSRLALCLQSSESFAGICLDIVVFRPVAEPAQVLDIDLHEQRLDISCIAQRRLCLRRVRPGPLAATHTAACTTLSNIKSGKKQEISRSARNPEVVLTRGQRSAVPSRRLIGRHARPGKPRANYFRDGAIGGVTADRPRSRLDHRSGRAVPSRSPTS
jgi:hypothetical protein